MIIFITQKRLTALIDARIAANKTPEKKNEGGTLTVEGAISALMSDGRKRDWKTVHKEIRRAGIKRMQHSTQSALSKLYNKGELDRISRGTYQKTKGKTSAEANHDI